MEIKKMKEHAIGEIFEYEGQKYICVEEETCKNCCFIGNCLFSKEDIHCSKNYRKDGKDTIYKNYEETKIKKPTFDNEEEYIKCLKETCVFDLSDKELKTSLRKAKKKGYIKKSNFEEAEELLVVIRKSVVIDHCPIERKDMDVIDRYIQHLKQQLSEAGK